MDYASNSKKDKENIEKRQKDPVEKVITGAVVQKPKGLGRKFKEIFFGGDAKQAVTYVSANVLLPALRNLIVDMVRTGTENLVYGSSRDRRGGPRINYGSRYDYGSSPIGRPYDSARPNFPPPPLPRSRQNRHDMTDMILGTREEADLVLERMSDILENYDVVSLADLNAMVGLETSHIDNKWGWTNLLGAQVRQNRLGFLLDLPPLEEL